MLGREDGFDATAVLDSFHLVLVIFSPSLEVRGSEDDYDSLMCGLLGYIFACPCGPRFKAMFTLRSRLRDPGRLCKTVAIIPVTGRPSLFLGSQLNLPSSLLLRQGQVGTPLPPWQECFTADAKRAHFLARQGQHIGGALKMVCLLI
jgi:hypothetical protein